MTAASIAAVATLAIAPCALGGSVTHALVVVSPAIAVKTAGTPPTATTTVVVRNDGAAVAAVLFSAVGDDANKVDVRTNGATGLEADTAKSFTLTITPGTGDTTFSGALQVAGAGATPGTVALSVAPTKTAPWWLYFVIFAPLGVAVTLVGACWRRFARSHSDCTLTTRIGPANWDFSKSWGSNLTVVGALLGTILSTAVLPDESATSKATYAGLNLLFGVLILVAPLLYTATQKPNDVHRTKTLKEPAYEGYVASFLAASILTLWATFGELTTVFLLFHEIQTARSLPTAAVVLMGALAAGAALLLGFYAFRSLGWIMARQCDVHRRDGELDAFSYEPTAAELAQVKPGWSLL